MNSTSNPQDYTEIVHAEWADYNNHMNVAFYVLIFDHGTDAFLARLGMNDALREATGSSVFVAEAHVTYDNEVMVGETVRVQSQVIDYDEKRLHLFHQMFKSDGELAATNELMILHVNLNTRKVSAFPEHVLHEISSIARIDTTKPKPKQLGQTIAIKRPAKNTS